MENREKLNFLKRNFELALKYKPVRPEKTAVQI